MKVTIILFIGLVSVLKANIAIATCVDQLTDCDTRAKTGLCERDVITTLVKCPFSCGTCQNWTGFEFENTAITPNTPCNSSKITSILCTSLLTLYHECVVPSDYVQSSIFYVGTSNGIADCKVGVSWGMHNDGSKLWIRGGCGGTFILYKGPNFRTQWKNKDAIILTGVTNTRLSLGSSVICPPQYDLVDCQCDSCLVNRCDAVQLKDSSFDKKPICIALNYNLAINLQTRTKAFCVKNYSTVPYKIVAQYSNLLPISYAVVYSNIVNCPANTTMISCFIDSLTATNDSRIGVIANNSCSIPQSNRKISALCYYEEPCKSTVSKCGVGAICTSTYGNYKCTCPRGKTGDPLKRCCKMMHCGCWGDPHCHTFDGSTYNFQGNCQYNFVSTINTDLPYGLVPFNVYTKQENRNGVKSVAYVKYVEANIDGISYKLLQRKVLLVNGIKTNVPYKANGTQVFITGGSMSLTTQFGLTIIWDGLWTVEASMCDAYAGYVNGLCGNADGNKTNDYSDPQGNLITGDIYHWKWGNTWRVYDNSGDKNPQCYVNTTTPIDNNTIPICRNKTVYQNWCSYITNTASIWRQCININQGFANFTYESCVFDLCAVEGNSTLQEQLKCTVYTQFNQYCSNLGFTASTWRSLVNCPMKCGTNETFALRKECPKTCLDLTGTEDCGEVIQREGCYCQTGFVLNSNQQCISPSNCGCLLPDGSSLISSGQSIMSNNCSFIYTCARPMSNVIIKNNYCQNDSSCKTDEFNNPSCICNDGFIAQANTCIHITTKTTTTPITTTIIPTTITTPTTTIPIPTPTITPTTPTTTTTPTFTSHKLCDQSKTCYGYGDPHYRTSDGYNFVIKQNCSYLFASDDCLKTSTFQIIVHQKYISENLQVSTINSIDINYNQINYSIDSSFHINNIDTSLPYSSQNDNINVYNLNHYTVFKTDLFELKFDGKQFLKFSHCDISLCGLCGIHDTSEIDNYVMKNPEYCI